MIGKLIRLFHTVRYLKVIQIYYRVYYRFRKPTKFVNSNEKVTLNHIMSFVEPCHKLTYLKEGKVQVIGQEIEFNDAVWHSQTIDKLALYNLNYFDFLNAEYRDVQPEALMTHWIENQYYLAPFALDAYPASLRIVNWLKCLQRSGNAEPVILNHLESELVHLSKNLEWHILGNHLFANAKALLFGGVLLQSQHANQFFKLGYDIYTRELEEQLLADGGNFELSPMYHAIFLEDLLDVYNLILAFPEHQNLQKLKVKTYHKIVNMFMWLKKMIHPDGEFSHFNDTALNVAPNYKSLRSYASRLGFSADELDSDVYQLGESGYVRIENSEFIVLFDAANVGPNYIPGHAHADTLSFELSTPEQRILVNSGTSVYGLSDERVRQRSGAAHNVLRIGQRDSSHVWSGFRVAQRAKVKKIHPIANGVEASHNGYSSIFGGASHTRGISLMQGKVTVEDRVNTSGEQLVELYFHCEPSIKLSVLDNHIELTLADQSALYFHKHAALSYQILDSTYHPGFNQSLPNKVIYAKARLTGDHTITHLLTKVH